MGTFETYQRRAVDLNGVTEPAQRAVALADLRALETEVSSAGLNGFERRSLLFTLSSVMINLASDAGSVDDVKSGRRVGYEAAGRRWIASRPDSAGGIQPGQRAGGDVRNRGGGRP